MALGCLNRCLVHDGVEWVIGVLNQGSTAERRKVQVICDLTEPCANVCTRMIGVGSDGFIGVHLLEYPHERLLDKILHPKVAKRAVKSSVADRQQVAFVAS